MFLACSAFVLTLVAIYVSIVWAITEEELRDD